MKRLIEAAVVVCLLDSVVSAQPVYFADPDLKAAVEAELGVTNPQVGHMLKLATLDAGGRGISDLTGLEYATNLTNLKLFENSISDLSPLVGLTNLTNLVLSSNQISDLSPLAGLTNLSALFLGGNQISDVSPLAGLTNLSALNLCNNQISDLSLLAGLTNLDFLALDDNQISDLSPLVGLTNLTVLFLGGNQISDLSPLVGLTNLSYLVLSINQISDLSPLAGLTNLTQLYLLGNQISDLSPLAGLTNLLFLVLEDNQISDVSPLAGLTNLDVLNLISNPLNQAACDVYIPQLMAKGVGVGDDCGTWLTVPDVVGLSESMAGAAITWMGLTVGTKTSQCSDTIPAGNVISQDPPAGVLAPVGSPVNLTVSSGPCSLRVPNVVGMSESQAVSTLTSAGLAVGTQYVENDTVPAGSVISQNPAAGSQTLYGSVIGLTISTGPATSPKVTVPNVVGMAQAAAEAAIRSAELVVRMVTQASSSTVPTGSVISQAPPAGTSLAKGSGVDLVVSSGPLEPTQVQVPNVVGMTQTAAEATIVGADLAVGTITHSPSQTVPQGQVISQNPQAGAQVARGWPVNLTVSTGSAPPGPILSDPVAHWRLDESTGTVARDETGKHHGTVYGHPIWQPSGGKLEGALLFDGADDYVDCGTFDPSAATGQLTVCLWAQWNGLNGWYQGLIGKRDSFSEQAMMWQVETTLDHGDLTFKQAADPGIGAAALPIGQWMHVAATFDGLTARLYLNGIQESSGAFSLGSGAAAQVIFGACEKNGGNPFNGALDDVRLYDEALSEDQIGAVMLGQGPVPSTLLPVAVAHWRLDESSGGVARDETDKHDGIVHGSPAWQPSGGKLEGALLFDGADDYVDCGTFNPSAATGQLTVCLWAQWNGLNGWYQGLIGKRDSFSEQAMMWQVETTLDTGNLTFKQAGHPGIGAGVLPIGEWTHIGVTFDGAIATFYLDGQTDNSGPFSFGSGTKAQVVFGACEKNGMNPFNGALDDVRLYDEALSEDQIKAVMAGSVAEPSPSEPGTPSGPAPGGLVAHWAFDETAGRVALDSAGEFDGFLMGGPIWQPGAGKVGGALDFDGSNDLVVTDFVLDPADGPFSVFAWVKGGGPGQVILSQDGSQAGLDWLVADPAGRLMTRLGGTGSGRFGTSLSSTTVITDGSWHEVGLVWDGANRTLYVDGVAVAEDRQTQLRGSTGGLNIGAGKDLDAGTYWSGLIDEVRIYHQAVRP